MASGAIPKHEFMKTSKSKAKSKNESNLGVLVTHNSMTFWMDKRSPDGTILYYTCSKKRKWGCQATAIVNKLTFIIDKESMIKEDKYVLSKCSGIEEHNHEREFATIIAEKIFMEMSEKVEAEPSLQLSKIHDQILNNYETEFGEHEFWDEIISALGKEESRIARLRRVRNRQVGQVPKSRDEFDPQPLLSKLPGGSSIIFLDSNNDLPDNWREKCNGCPVDPEKAADELLNSSGETNSEQVKGFTSAGRRHVLSK
jgi:hypothetical protein